MKQSTLFSPFHPWVSKVGSSIFWIWMQIGKSDKNIKHNYKQCRSWWDGMLWAVSSGSTLFAKLIFRSVELKGLILENVFKTKSEWTIVTNGKTCFHQVWATIFDLITAHTPIRAQSSNCILSLLITASTLSAYFFTKEYIFWVPIWIYIYEFPQHMLS